MGRQVWTAETSCGQAGADGRARQVSRSRVGRHGQANTDKWIWPRVNGHDGSAVPVPGKGRRQHVEDGTSPKAAACHDRQRGGWQRWWLCKTMEPGQQLAGKGRKWPSGEVESPAVIWVTPENGAVSNRSASARGVDLGGRPSRRGHTGGGSWPERWWRQRKSAAQNVLAGGQCGGASAGARVGSIVDDEAVMIVIRWPEAGRNLAGGGPKWWRL